jgi:hypothetical protein
LGVEESKKNPKERESEKEEKEGNKAVRMKRIERWTGSNGVISCERERERLRS